MFPHPYIKGKRRYKDLFRQITKNLSKYVYVFKVIMDADEISRPSYVL